MRVDVFYFFVFVEDRRKVLFQLTAFTNRAVLSEVTAGCSFDEMLSFLFDVLLYLTVN